MYSFYGGKQGRTYKLVQHYDSIQQMVEYFQQGGSYNTVNYGQYVIIDTIFNNNNYNSPENGIIYRRGLNYAEVFNPNGLNVNENGTISKEDVDQQGNKRYYDVTQDSQGNEIVVFNDEAYRSAFAAFVQNPGGGAEYVGQIVGPQGEAPELSLLDWDAFLQKYQDPAAADLNKKTYFLDPPAGVEFDEEGQVIDGSIKDTIDYGYLDIKDADGNITGAYIAFNIPYSVFKYHAESIEPYDTGYAEYDTTERVWKYKDLISEDEISQGHHFFWQYDIKVPKGVRGQDLEKFDINIDPSLISEDGNDILPGEDNNNYRYYRIYRNYERSAEGTPTLEYLDSWQRTIHKITHDGTIPEYEMIQRQTYYDIDSRVYANGLGNHLCLMAVVAGVTDTEALPALETFERGRTFVDGSVTWQVIEDTVTSPGLLTVHYTHGDNDEIKVRLLDDVIINENNGRIYAKYSDLDSLVYLGENQSIIGVEYVDTPWIDPSGMSHTIDRICIKYNTYNYGEDGRVVANANFSLDGQGNLVFPTTDMAGRRIQYIDEQFKFVDRIETDPLTKDVTAYYNDGTQTTLGVLKSIGDIYVKNEGDLSQPKYLTVQYNNQQMDGSYEEDHINQHPLNDVACIQQYGDNIILLYSDPAVRQSLYRAGTDYAIAKNVYTVPGYDTSTADDDGNGNLYWINLGSIYHSNHVFGSFDSLAQLQQEYPYGFDKNTSGQDVPQHKDHAGWLATITDSQTDAVSMYAYDYRSGNGWYQILDLSASSINPQWVMVIDKQDTTQSTPMPSHAKDSLLTENGYWFVVSERAD